MKMFYQLAFALLISMGLTACGSSSMFEVEMMEADAGGTAQTENAGKIAVPEGCVSWFDGCNTCTVKDGAIGGCTKMACKSQAAEAACRTFAPGFGESAAATEVVTEEGPAPDTMPETKRDASAEVPANCKIWFDGCNSCVVMRGKLRGCTSKVCTTQAEPSCTNSN